MSNYVTKGVKMYLKGNPSAGAGAAHRATFDSLLSSIQEDTHTTGWVETIDGDNCLVLHNVQEIGAIKIGSNKGTSSFDQIEITTLADTRHVYVNGLSSDGETSNEGIAIKLLYEPVIYKFLADIHNDEVSEMLKGVSANYVGCSYTIQLPEDDYLNSKFGFQATIASVELDSISINSALTMTINLVPVGTVYVSTSQTTTE